MIIFKIFLKTTKKSLGSIIPYFAIFFLIIMMLSQFGGNNAAEFSETKITMAVFDHDNTTLSNALYNYLNETQDITQLKEDRDLLIENLYSQMITYVLFIPEGFEEKILNAKDVSELNDITEYMASSGSTSTVLMDNKISGYVKTLATYIIAGVDKDKAIENTNDIQNTATTVSTLSGNDAGEKSMPYYFFQYLPHIMINVIMSGLGLVYLTFRKKDLANRITCSSLSVKSQNLQIILGSSIYVFVTFAIFVIAAIAIFGDTLFNTTGGLYILNTAVFAIFTLALTYFVSYVIKSQNGLSGACNICSLGLSFLGGVFVPMEVMSGTVLKISQFLPTYWYIKAHNIAEEYTGSSAQIKDFLLSLGIQLLFAITLFAGALVLQKRKNK